MAERNFTEPVALSGWLWTNWNAEGAPPVVMNPSASTHALIAWCWGEAVVVKGLSMTAVGITDPAEFGDLNLAMRERLVGIVTVLNELGQRNSSFRRDVPNSTVNLGG